METLMPEFSIRPYCSSDRDDLFRIAADTAFFGEPVEAYLEDRRVFNDAFYRYYTDYEPEHAWVACADEQVIGFLTGCVDTRRQQQIFSRKLVPEVLWGLLIGRYRRGPKTLWYIRSLVKEMRQDDSPPLDLDAYPAHLHINLDAAWRGHGLGRRLIAAYLDQLRSLGIPGVHLYTTSMNEAACRLYEKSGFRLMSAHPSYMWKPLIEQPIENRCYAMKLE